MIVEELLIAELLHGLSHRFPDQIVSLGVAIPMVALPGWGFFGGAEKTSGLDAVDVALKFGIGLRCRLGLTNQEAAIPLFGSPRQSHCLRSQRGDF